MLGVRSIFIDVCGGASSKLSGVQNGEDRCDERVCQYCYKLAVRRMYKYAVIYTLYVCSRAFAS